MRQTQAVTEVETPRANVMEVGGGTRGEGRNPFSAANMALGQIAK